MVDKPFLIVRADVKPIYNSVTQGKKYLAYGVEAFVFEGVLGVSGYITTDTGDKQCILISGFSGPCAVLGADWTVVKD